MRYAMTSQVLTAVDGPVQRGAHRLHVSGHVNTQSVERSESRLGFRPLLRLDVEVAGAGGSPLSCPRSRKGETLVTMEHRCDIGQGRYRTGGLRVINTAALYSSTCGDIEVNLKSAGLRSTVYRQTQKEILHDVSFLVPNLLPLYLATLYSTNCQRRRAQLRKERICVG